MFNFPTRCAIRTAYAVLLLLVASDARAQQACGAGSMRHVGASGTAVLRLPPDRVTFVVGVNTTAAGVAQALASNTSKVAAVLAALKAKGVPAAEIQTSQVLLGAARDDIGRRTLGFQASNQISVVRRDPAEAGPLLEAAVGAGANSVENFRLYVADSSSQRGRGMQLAFEDARSKATRLAELSGGALGNVVCAVEGGYSTTGFSGVSETVTVAAEPLPIEAGLEEIPFSVYDVFELR
jgi:uncharacterized protein YggE